jgi:hypothetical protein
MAAVLPNHRLERVQLFVGLHPLWVDQPEASGEPASGAVPTDLQGEANADLGHAVGAAMALHDSLVRPAPNHLQEFLVIDDPARESASAD